MRLKTTIAGVLCLFLVQLAMAGPPRAKKSKPPAKPPAQEEPEQPTVAIYNFNALGLSEETVRQAEEDLRQAVARSAGVALLTGEEVIGLLKVAKVPAGAPLAKVLAVLRTTWLLTGTLGGMGEDLSLDLKLLDGASGKELRRVAIAVPQAEAERKAVLDELSVQLLRPEKWVGALALEVSADGAQVHVDGNQIALSPLKEPIAGLQPGKHILRIVKEGFGEFSKFVVVRYNDTVHLKVDLENAMVVGLLYERDKPMVPVPPEPEKETPRPAPPPPVVGKPPPRQPSAFKSVMAWTFVGVGAAALGVGLWAVLTNEGDKPFKTIFGPVGCTAGGLALVGGLVLFLLDDGEEPVAVVPGAIPGGAVLVLTGRF